MALYTTQLLLLRVQHGDLLVFMDPVPLAACLTWESNPNLVQRMFCVFSSEAKGVVL